MRRTGILGVVLAAGLATGCFVEISHVGDPSEAFREAKAEAERLQGRPGPAHHVNVLVWDRDERELVRVSAPLWLVRKVAHNGDIDLGSDEDGDEHWKRAVRRHVNLDELAKAGLGVLVEVEEDAGDRVLVWLR
jgi:hypothetical protein